MNRQPRMNDRNTSNKRSRRKNILMSKWHLIQNQPLLREVFREPPIVSYKKGKSLKDILVSVKL